MFDEFVKPELAATCRRLSNTMYHLDGVGELNHLPSLLTIPELDAVQWVPGAGKPDASWWPEVLLAIKNAGKNAQICGNLDSLDRTIQLYGTGKGVHLRYDYQLPVTQKAQAIELLGRYGI